MLVNIDRAMVGTRVMIPADERQEAEGYRYKTLWEDRIGMQLPLSFRFEEIRSAGAEWNKYMD
jgi:hypothetical protein